MRTIDITRLDRPRTEPRSTVYALAVAAALFAFVTWRMVSPRSSGGATPAHVAASGIAPAFEPQRRGAADDLTASEHATIEVFRRASPGVVHVTNIAKVASRRSFEDVVQGTGSGFVWDRDGHVVTNFHVVRGSDAVYVRFAGDAQNYAAKIVNIAPHNDLAVLELLERPQSPLQPIEVGRSVDLQVGQQVYAIGNPFGLDQTLSSGLISGLGREIRSVTDHKIGGVIQTDAAINPGNSGGPLLDSRGRIIGVNTAIVTLSGAYNGIGFAVPIDAVRRVVDEIITTGRVTRPGLGVVLLSDVKAQRLRLRGVGIESVRDGSVAQKAGLRSAALASNGVVAIDEIVAIDDVVVRSARDLFDALDGRAVGDDVTLKVRRGDEVFEASLRLQALRD